MALTQETFLGSSIRNFSASLGWGTSPSTLEVGLVDDVTNGDSFSPPITGSPVYFEYQGWRFGGLLQSYNKSYGQNGNPVYTVQVQDPRELLDGVQLILQDYAGEVGGIRNIYNIYGYLENTYGFGAAQTNDTGIPWKLIRQALSEMQGTTPIRFRGEDYTFVPFFGLDVLPDYYRVGGDSISLLGFVDEICSAIAADYFIGMTYEPVGSVNTIGLHLIDRSVPLANDVINDYVTEVEDAVAKETGEELRNEVTTKFLVGGKVNAFYYQTQGYINNDSAGITYDNIIWPYWGYDCFDDLVIMDVNGNFRLDGRVIYIETGITYLINYKTNVKEMRAALDGQDSWEAYLWMEDNNKESVHYKKASALGLTEGLSSDIETVIREWVTNPDVAKDFGRNVNKVRDERSNVEFGSYQQKTHNQRVSKIYEWVNQYATEYYGRKFMVRIPFVLAARIPEINELRFSVQPSEGAFVDEAEYATVAPNGLMPYNTTKFEIPDGRISSYVRFARTDDIETDNESTFASQINSTDLNMSDFSPDDYIIDQIINASAGKMRENLYVRGELDEDLVFLDPNTLYSPRVVVTLPARVKNNSQDDLTVIEDRLKEIIRDERKGPNQDGDQEFIDKISKTYGADLIWYDSESTACIPDMAALSLESNILRYGPWYATGSAGKVDYQIDETLVPWNYNGYTYLNLVGSSRVNDALSTLEISEKGSVEFPGIPDRSLGEALLDSGPTITDITVNVGEQGVTTKYTMSTWTWRFGRAGKYNLDRLLRLNKIVQEQRKSFRILFSKAARFGRYGVNYSSKVVKEPRRRGKNSSVNLLAGDVIVTGSGDSLSVKSSVAGIAGYRVLSQTDPDNYATQAGISLDGVFVPFTTAPSGELAYTSYLPKFETPTDGASTPTVDDLNPFGSQGIAAAFPESSGLPDNLLSESYEGHVKGVGLKSPIIIGGWGRDTANNPVPSDGEGGYVSNYKTRVDLWKVGPLDVRWDDDRKVWTFEASQMYIGKTTEDILKDTVGIVEIYHHAWEATGITVEVYNPHDIDLPEGLRVRWGTYPGWDGNIVEPWDWTEC